MMEQKLETQTVLKFESQRNGRSSVSNTMGMREMQARAFERRNSQYLLIKAPPACGKSRALMFLALDKVEHQGIEKVLVAVPQQAIGSSFRDTDLMSTGFFADWKVDPIYNLCGPGNDDSKANIVAKFYRDPNAHYLVCSHATLNNFYKHLKEDNGDIHQLDHTLIAIDEFHHVSADDGNRLGSFISDAMNNSSAHIVAMTGSYFRGDSVPILSPQDEERFDKVTYTYYEQLNGYKYLKTLLIDYAFYSGRYIDAVKDCLDVTRKTIIHIPSINSRESTKDKYNEVSAIFDAIGNYEGRDQGTGLYSYKTDDGKILKIADLVTDDEMRGTTLNYLRTVKTRDEVDMIVALGMAKEGFDWPWCEQVLTIGYRNSLTEVVQIIGRATRDCEGKTVARFTNLIAKPDALQDDVENGVNSLLKAITLSLLMQQVLAPNIHFRARSTVTDDENLPPNTIVIDDTNARISDAGREVLQNDLEDLVTSVLNDDGGKTVAPALLGGNDSGAMETLEEITIPEIIRKKYPELTPDDIEIIKQAVVTQIKVKPNLVENPPAESAPEDGATDQGGLDLPPEPSIEIGTDNTAFLKMQNKFINLDDIDINMVSEIKPFQGAYDFLSKSIDSATLHKIQDIVTVKRSDVTEEEAMILWPKVKRFVREHNKEPNLNSSDEYERRLAEVLAYVRRMKAQSMSKRQEG